MTRPCRRAPMASLLFVFAALAASGACAARNIAPAPAPPSAAEEAVRLARLMRLMELNRQRVQLELEMAGHSQRLGENHPDMVRLRRQIAVVDSAIAREGGAGEARLKEEPESAEAQTELALLYMRQGKLEEADRALSKAIALLKVRASGR